jgi:hypothetical protein
MRRWRGGPTQGVGTLLVVLLLTGCTGLGGGDAGAGPDEAPAATQPTSLASYDARGVTVVRGPFCQRVSPTGVEHALGEPPRRSRGWANGDRVRLPDGTRDRVQEFGCSWTGPGGAVARAWVFATPITRERARGLARDAGGPGCRARTGVGFGQVSVSTRCTERGRTTATYRGLFGDAWLTCELTADAPAEAVVQRTGEWCVAVLEATRA